MSASSQWGAVEPIEWRIAAYALHLIATRCMLAPLSAMQRLTKLEKARPKRQSLGRSRVQQDRSRGGWEHGAECIQCGAPRCAALFAPSGGHCSALLCRSRSSVDCTAMACCAELICFSLLHPLAPARPRASFPSAAMATPRGLTNFIQDIRNCTTTDERTDCTATRGCRAAQCNERRMQ